eukprot:gene34278-38742_t
MLDSTDHATNGRRIFQGADPVHLVEAQTDQRCALDCRTANRRTDLVARGSAASLEGSILQATLSRDVLRMNLRLQGVERRANHVVR